MAKTSRFLLFTQSTSYNSRFVRKTTLLLSGRISTTVCYALTMTIPSSVDDNPPKGIAELKSLRRIKKKGESAGISGNEKPKNRRRTEKQEILHQLIFTSCFLQPKIHLINWLPLKAIFHAHLEKRRSELWRWPKTSLRRFCPSIAHPNKENRLACCTQCVTVPSLLGHCIQRKSFNTKRKSLLHQQTVWQKRQQQETTNWTVTVRPQRGRWI